MSMGWVESKAEAYAVRDHAMETGFKKVDIIKLADGFFVIGYL